MGRGKTKLIRAGGRYIGILIGNTYIQVVKRSKHFMRLFQGWGKDKQTLEDLRRQGCTTIQFIDKEYGKVYLTSINQFFSQGIEGDFGSGLQIFLPEREWEVGEIDQQGLFADQ